MNNIEVNFQTYQNKIEDKLKEIIIDLLKPMKNKMDFSKSFFEMGINSILAVKMIEIINKELGLDLGIEVIFDYTDLKSLISYILSECSRKKVEKKISEGKCNDGKNFEITIDYIKNEIIECIANLLKCETRLVHADKSFFEMGINSMLSMELIEKINKKLNINLEFHVVFDYTSSEELSQYIYERLGEKSKQNFLNSNKELKSDYKQSDIAIIGISGRFADSETVEEFWENIKDGKTCIKEITRRGWKEDKYYSPNLDESNKSISKWGGFISDIDKFDPLFFHISPKEAERMDPQQRLFLQEAYKAFENSGYSQEDLSNKKIGVFVAARSSDYKDKVLKADGVSSQTFLGNDNAILSARISYFLNLKGPSMTINTACSSSLVAIHLACESIRRNESISALAGGVFLLNSPEFYLMISKAGMLSPDGKCKTFDDDANGIVVGEGVGALVLKRLDEAVKDGDYIYAVIKGSAINQDGMTKGITAPSMISQKQLISGLYKKISINPETITYMEAHGTGTKLGDPIEVKALSEAFSMFTSRKKFCAIGSHKPNFGHMIMAAGMGGVFKIIMAMKNKLIPPHIGMNNVNKYIDFDQSAFFVNRKALKWESEDGSPLRAGISGFGFGGTNCHMVIEEAPYIDRNFNEANHQNYIITFSAKTETALNRKMQDMLKWVRKNGHKFFIGDISYTLLTGRSHFPIRCAFVVSNLSELEESIKGICQNDTRIKYFINKENNIERNNFNLKGLNKYGEEIIKKINIEENLTVNESKEKLYYIADLYVKGENINWKCMFEKEEYSRVPLPTYPFDQKSYWIEEAKLNNDCKMCIQPYIYKNPLAEQKSSNLMVFEEIYEEKSLKYDSNINISVLMCFVSNEDDKKNIIDYVKGINREIKIIFVFRGSEYIKKSKCEYTLDIANENCYKKIFCDVKVNYHKVDAIFNLWPVEDKNFMRNTECILYILKTVINEKIDVRKIFLIGEFKNELQRCYLESWIGFQRSFKMISNNTQVFVLYKNNKNSNYNMEKWLRKLFNELNNTNGQSILYKDEKRYIRKIRPIQIKPKDSLIKDGGTYIILGGLGKIGVLISEYLVGIKNINLILIGRSSLDREKQIEIKKLQKYGSEVLYIQANICDREVMQKKLYIINKKFGNINGIIHAAGVESKQNINEKDIYKFKEVLDPKIKGTIVIDEVIKQENIDFICYFSSLSAIIGDFGGCDYAIANRFQMSYAYYRNNRRDNGKCKGKTVVINWPIWKDGNMGHDKADSLYLNISGQKLLKSQDALNMFETLIAQEGTQYLVMNGDLQKVYEMLKVSYNELNKGSSEKLNLMIEEKGNKIDNLNIKQYIILDLKKHISRILKIACEVLDTSVDFYNIGFDSMTFTEFSKQLSNYYKFEIMPTVFYGYSSIEKLSEYLLSKYGNEIEQFYENNKIQSEVEQKIMLNPQPYQKKFVENEKEIEDNLIDPIAIVGMSGRFPGARNINEMWSILDQEKNTIREMPSERITWRKNYNDVRENSQTNYKWCGCMPGIGEFDPLFFEISPKEAENMDPRQRLLLQESWNALENAGYGEEQIQKNKIGMFIGAEEGDYQAFADDGSSITSNCNSILAARLAYFLNLNGPVMTIDTACSSGLVSVHQACQSLRNGECTTAIAGGVSLLLSSDVVVKMNEAGMLSVSGRCYAFDKRADGMVPSEAVAVVVLKTLSRAKADGDNIYAVIKGSGINYDGKTNGITAPNGVSQTNLYKYVYDKYKIDPGEIGCVITHGTGTKLGDPIEVNALNDAFMEYTKKQKYCAIISVKPNFGHTLAASGIVNLIALVEALTHKMIPASLNFNNGNDYIQWTKSPFYVNTEKQIWKENSSKKRLGAVSSFGMSGTNVHMVVESYCSEESKITEENLPCYLLVFSAKSQEALQEKINDIVNMLKSTDKQKYSFFDISYTLMERRHHFKYRCAIVAKDLDNLIYILNADDGRKEFPNLFKRVVDKNFIRQKIIQEYVDNLVQKSWSARHDKLKYQDILFALADFYCQGYNISGNKLYGTTKPLCAVIPTYPFTKEIYWSNNFKSHNFNSDVASEKKIMQIHPLVHQNVSDFFVQRFKSIFTGKEIFFREHEVNGKKVFPGVAYLEIARIAFKKSLGNSRKDNTNVVLKNVYWIRPIIYNGKEIEVNIEFEHTDDKNITYKVYRKVEKVNDNLTVYSQGEILIVAGEKPKKVDLDFLRSQCANKIMNSEECYRIFNKMGICYGELYHGIDSVYIGKGKVLSKLIIDNVDGCDFNISLMDSALQTSAILMMDIDVGDDIKEFKTYLPFAVEEIEFLEKFSETMWAYASYSNSSSIEDGVKRFDIDVFDNYGMVCMRIKGFSSRVVSSDSKNIYKTVENVNTDYKKPLVGNITFTPIWDTFSVSNSEKYLFEEDKILIINNNTEEKDFIRERFKMATELCINPDDDIATINKKIKFIGVVDHVIWIGKEYKLSSMSEESIIDDQENGVIQLFKIVKAFLELGYENKSLRWIIVTNQVQSISEKDTVNPSQASIYGFVGSMMKEYTNWNVRVIDVEAGCNWAKSNFFNLPLNQNGSPWVYRKSKWYYQKLVSVDYNFFSKDNSVYRHKGVYVVIGGAGGLGEVWSEYMIRTYQAQIIWIGRRTKNEDIQNKINKLSRFGSTPLYITADASSSKDLQCAYKEIKKNYEHIDGVIHAAIVLLDKSLNNMKENEIRKSLKAKINVSVRLAQIFKNENLDFVMFFSSLMSFTQNPGQSNYSAGCTFKDAFAKQLSKEWKCAVKVINWGYWGNVGIVASEKYKTIMKRLGIDSIQPREAMDVLERLVNGGVNQIAFVKATGCSSINIAHDKKIICYVNSVGGYSYDLENYISNIEMKRKEQNIISDSNYVLILQRKLAKIASEVIKIDVQDLDINIKLKDFGFDYTALSEFLYKINETYKIDLPLSIFIQKQTISSLVEYIMEINGRKIQNKEGTDFVYHDIKKEMDDMMYKIVWEQLKHIGCFDKKYQTIENIRANSQIRDSYSKWLFETIRILVKNDYLKIENGLYTVKNIGDIEIDDLWKAWEDKKKIWLKNKDVRAHICLVEKTMKALPEILTGKLLSTDIIFPNSSMKLVEGIYKNNNAADFYNSLLGDILVAYLKERLKYNKSDRIRILEIGAGTGGTSEMMFKKLELYKSCIEEYCYTDISRSFLIHAEEKYGVRNSYLTYKVLNIENSISNQEIDFGKYDVVIATNVLHATKNICKTLDNAKAILKHKGIILLNEMSANSLFNHLTFGLLKGWWMYEDDLLRISGCPGLESKVWKKVLMKGGFYNISFPLINKNSLQQQIIVAQSDGIIRKAIKKQENVDMIKSNDVDNLVVKRNYEGIETGENGTNVKFMKDKFERFIKKLMTETLKIPYNKIDTNDYFEKYGIDSISVIQLTNKLSKYLNNVNSSLFFEYKTINELVEYFIKNEKNQVIKLLGFEKEKVEENLNNINIHKEPKYTKILTNKYKDDLYGIQSQLNKKVDKLSDFQDVAIIGISGRFPCSDDIEQFWTNIENGQNCITEIPKERWNWEKYYSKQRGEEGKLYTKWGGFIQDIDKFDPLFFNISPAEAEKMDPQERVFLESVYSSIQDAGYTPSNICSSRKIGIFAGIMNGNYGTGSRYWSIANRVSYTFDFQGPSIAVDTACSSSLTAIHLAIESLYSGTSECAIAGGVNLILNPIHYLRLCEMTMLSSGNKCRAFGDKADGFVDAEGVGTIVLKSLKAAIRDGDHIYGVIKSSTVNSGGKTNGYTVPNPKLHSKLVEEALEKAHIDARTISYIEAHGTGTALGDPIEIAGLSRAFQKYTNDKQFCSIGSVKSNIGHCESASGIASVIKVLLQLKYGKLVPSLHCEVLNKNINFDNTPFVVQRKLTDWKRPLICGHEILRRAGISSFGAGGANAHIIIEEYSRESKEGSAYE